jgi:hypothetical protein
MCIECDTCGTFALLLPSYIKFVKAFHKNRIFLTHNIKFLHIIAKESHPIIKITYVGRLIICMMLTCFCSLSSYNTQQTVSIMDAINDHILKSTYVVM